MTDPYLVLGLDKNSNPEAAQKAFKELSARLETCLATADQTDAQQAGKALVACRKANDAIASGAKLEAEKTGSEGLSARLRLGQLCLATHMISLEQLQEAVEHQANSDKQLGEILQDLHFISQQELDGLLIGQDLIVGDEEVKDPQALRLLALGLITEDLAVIGLLETRSTGDSFIKVLNRRHWVSKTLTDLIFAPDA